MAALSFPFQPTNYKRIQKFRFKRSSISSSMQPSQNNIKVVINGATKEIGKAAIVAVTKARGMEVAGAVDSHFVGEDIGKVCNMEEALEIPIINDLTMVLGSISQSKATGVVIDLTEPSTVYDNVKQATAFGMKSVVYVPRINLETVTALSAFCEKASMGCLIAPTLSIGSILLQQAAISASFHYNNVEIVESRPNASDLPSPDAIQIANNLSNLGQIYNREDLSTNVLARGQLLGEDGIRVHSLVLPGLPSSTKVHFSGPGEVYCLEHNVTDVQCLMPGLILAIRKVVRLKAPPLGEVRETKFLAVLQQNFFEKSASISLKSTIFTCFSSRIPINSKNHTKNEIHSRKIFDVKTTSKGGKIDRYPKFNGITLIVINTIISMVRTMIIRSNKSPWSAP
ncbi:Dihydrodipicolinate reductase [Macleaya cordata]|uniref:Dihydrodipicolinate reductase n=1 Tax=Macleaya cordata TaxID=56857 RepID=A0A200QUM4_MACCD|nr:Dihydrodipicolinate reductase [Macleaya cordata]